MENMQLHANHRQNSNHGSASSYYNTQPTNK